MREVRWAKRSVRIGSSFLREGFLDAALRRSLPKRTLSLGAASGLTRPTRRIIVAVTQCPSGHGIIRKQDTVGGAPSPPARGLPALDWSGNRDPLRPRSRSGNRDPLRPPDACTRHRRGGPARRTQLAPGYRPVAGGDPGIRADITASKVRTRATPGAIFTLPVTTNRTKSPLGGHRKSKKSVVAGSVWPRASAWC